MQIIPTILEKEFERAKEKILAVKEWVKMIQIDVIDGRFLPGKTFELELINRIEGVENILWETHLMVKEPINWIEKSLFVNCHRIIGQVEAMSDREKIVKTVKDTGAEAGLAWDIETEINWVPAETDVVLLLGRKAGFGEEEFDKKVWQKVEKLRRIRQERDDNFKIALDGGMTESKITKAKTMGVEIAYCGRSVFDGKVNDNLEKLIYAGKN
jgi:ribulose-phosphate 3-epimerase